MDDAPDEQRREEAKLPEQRRKGYETLLHDAVLWHAVMNRRSANVDSPFDVEFWAVSIDWHLISFDRKKCASIMSRMPVVLHPSTLVQLVQFWVLRSTALEESRVNSLRLPIFFQSFDPDDERATVKALEALSRYKDIGDLPEQTLKKILTNQALRGKLRDADASNDETIALIRDELLTEHREALSELETVRGDLHGAKDSLQAERLIREQSEAELGVQSKVVRDTASKLQAAEQSAKEEKEKRKSVEAQLKSPTDAAEATERQLLRTFTSGRCWSVHSFACRPKQASF